MMRKLGGLFSSSELGGHTYCFFVLACSNSMWVVTEAALETHERVVSGARTTRARDESCGRHGYAASLIYTIGDRKAEKRPEPLRPPPCWFSHNLARPHRQPAHLRAPFFFFPDGGCGPRSVGDDNRDFIKKPMLTARDNKCGEAARNRQIIGQSPQRGVCVSSDRPRLSDGLPHDGGEAASLASAWTCERINSSRALRKKRNHEHSQHRPLD